MLRLTLDPRDVLLHALAQRRAIVPGLGCLRFQPLLQRSVPFRFKNAPKDFHALLRVCLQQAPKLSLGDHGDLRKLLSRYPQNGLHLGIHILQSGDHAPIRQRQFRLRLLRHQLISPFGRTLIFRAAPHGVGFPGVNKHQLHLRRRLRIRILGAQHIRRPAVPAGLPEQGKADGIKNRRFPGTGIPGDEIQPPAAQLLQGQLCFPGIGAKGGHG